MKHPRKEGHPAPEPGPMTIPTRDEWLERCAAVLRVRGGMTPDDALKTAEAQFENIGSDLTENPEDAAEDEMSYWTED